LKELGTSVSTEFLIAATSERMNADPGESKGGFHVIGLACLRNNLHAIARQQIKSVPGLIVELDMFAAH
jgi:hypothetical protein